MVADVGVVVFPSPRLLRNGVGGDDLARGNGESVAPVVARPVAQGKYPLVVEERLGGHEVRKRRIYVVVRPRIGAVCEGIIDAAAVPHPSGDVVRRLPALHALIPDAEARKLYVSAAPLVVVADYIRRQRRYEFGSQIAQALEVLAGTVAHGLVQRMYIIRRKEHLPVSYRLRCLLMPG